MRFLTTKTAIRNALLIGACGGTTIVGAQMGCSSPGAVAPEKVPSPQNGGAPADGTGSVGMQLTLPGGEQINTVSWTVTGPNGASTVVQTGSVNVGNSTTVSFLVSGIPAAANYTIALTGTSVDGTVTCAGSATFSTTARTTTNVMVALQCSTPAQEAGSALVTGTTFDCATWSSVSVSPAETTVGNSVAVSASATGPNPSAVTYAWSAPTGSFDTPAAASANFKCAVPGPVTLTLTVSDGAVPEGSTCSPTLSTATVQVTCDGHLDQAQQFATATKIKHLVIIFNENISFDHYFGTYPVAQNNSGEASFSAAVGTPTPNNLSTPLDPTHGFAPASGPNLLTNNPTTLKTLAPPANGNGTGALNPFRLNAANAGTADQGHNYLPEQEADDLGAMDLFPRYTGTAGPPPDAGVPGATTTGLVMAYFDGNVLGTYWNWAQSYAVNDNSWTTNFGPSSPGAINLISGQTNGIGATNHTPSTSHAVPDGFGGLTMIGDADPLNDVCSGVNDSSTTDQVQMTGKNIGDLLNAKGISWGWFQGGFDLTIADTGPGSNGLTGCKRSTQSQVPGTTSSPDYIQHHTPFQYYASTSNPMHTRPSSLAAIGTSADVANHNYDSHDFFDALAAGNLPAVVYLKAPAYQDGHPGYSDPIDEQAFASSVVTALQNAQEWSSSAVVIHYDDSDGWYDHQAPPIVNASQTVSDALNLFPSGTTPGICNSGAQQNGGAAATTVLVGAPPGDGGAPQLVQGRCAYGTRIPLIVISPFAKRNFIDHTLTDQTSTLKFIEDNWLAGQRVQPGGSFDTIANSITNMLSGI
jgi:phospholipase C